MESSKATVSQGEVDNKSKCGKSCIYKYMYIFCAEL